MLNFSSTELLMLAPSTSVSELGLTWYILTAPKPDLGHLGSRGGNIIPKQHICRAAYFDFK